MGKEQLSFLKYKWCDKDGNPDIDKFIINVEKTLKDHSKIVTEMIKEFKIVCDNSKGNKNE